MSEYVGHVRDRVGNVVRVGKFSMCQKCKDLEDEKFLSLTIYQVAQWVLLHTLCAP